MQEDTSTNIAWRVEGQRSVNAERWARGDLVDDYASGQLRGVEHVILDRYRGLLRGRVLELGCGAGRLTGHLYAVAQELDAIDISPAMVAHCQQAYPKARFIVTDLRELSAFDAASYDAVLAPFNVLDVLADDERRAELGQIRALLRPGGILVMSSHNLPHALRIRTRLRLMLRLLIGSPRRPLRSLGALRRRLANRRQLRPLQRVAADHAVINDEAHDFSLLHYYISRDAQEKQLGEAGYDLLECLDLAGGPVAPGAAAAHCPELHYIARARSL